MPEIDHLDIVKSNSFSQFLDLRINLIVPVDTRYEVLVFLKILLIIQEMLTIIQSAHKVP